MAGSNPFATRFWTPGTIPFYFGRNEDTELERLAGCFVKRRSVAQIVGPHGSGKSTLLESLAVYFEKRGFRICREFLNDEHRRLPDDFSPGKGDPNALFFLDGYEQLSLVRRLLLRCRNWPRTAGLLWTTHRPAPGIPILYRTAARFEVFSLLVRQLSESTSTKFDEPTLKRIFEKTQGNFRSAFFELYDRFAAGQFPENDQ